MNYKLQTESINDKSEFHASHVDVLLIYVWEIQVENWTALKIVVKCKKVPQTHKTDCDLFVANSLQPTPIELVVDVIFKLEMWSG